MPAVNLDDLRALLDVARSGSVSKTAAALRLTQPAVTRRIQRLEASLGVALLDRRARPIALTAAGRDLVGRLPKLFAALDDLRVARPPSDEGVAHFRLGLVTSLADRIAEDVVGRLRRVFPRLALSVAVGWTPELLRRFREAELDAVVVYLPDDFVAPSYAAVRFIGRVPLVAVGVRPRRARAAARHPESKAWILNASGCYFREVLARVLRASGAPLRVALEVDGIDRQLRLVAQGAGLGFVPAPLLPDSPLRARLQLLPLPADDVSISVGIVYRQPQPSLRAVPEQIQRHLQRWLKESSRRTLPSRSVHAHPASWFAVASRS